MNCGEKIADLRKKNGMTQDDLGKAMNVSYQAVSKWERDESQPDFDTMTKIAKLFNVPLGYFAEGGENAVTETASAEATKSETEETSEEVKDEVAGNCVECGRLVKESDVASYSPKLICKECAKRKAEEKLKQQRLEQEKAKSEKLLAAQEVIGHGFDAKLIVSLILAFAGYVALTVLTLVNAKSDDAYFYGFLVFFCPIILFACTHAVADAVADWRDLDDEQEYTRNLSLVVGAIFAVLNVAIFLTLHFVVGGSDDFYFLLIMGLGAVLSFTFVSQFLWGGVIKEIFTAGGFTFKLPGFIFSLSVDSIIWMIVTKFFLGIIAAILFVITTVLMAVIAVFASVFFFIPSVLNKTRKDHNARRELNK